MEPLIEVGMAIFFAVSYLFWPVELAGGIQLTIFGLWLLAGVGLAIMFAYDSKWFLLPDSINFAVIGIGLVSAIVTIIGSTDKIGAILNVVGSIVILSGLYFILWLVSKGRWIGFGDIKLGLGLGLLLADWKLALIALFFANLMGCIIVIPLMVTGKLKRNARVPFGPLLIAGAVITKLVGDNC